MSKSRVFNILQRIGQAFQLPIALLPVAGLFLGFGSSFTNETVINTYGLSGILGKGSLLHNFFLVLSSAGGIVFDNLPILFAIAVALAMTNREKATAALSGAVGFFVMHATINAVLKVRGWLLENGQQASFIKMGEITDIVGITSLSMGVFGGIIVGLGVAAITNRYYNIKMPVFLAFFEGTRFIPIMTAITYLGVGILMAFIWPPIQNVIFNLSNLINVLGYFGTFLYGLIERSLIPFGLHHVFYLPFWQTALGGTLDVAGRLVEGGQNIFFAQLADPTTQHFNVETTRWMSGKFLFMMFGLPGAALAFYHTAKPEKKKVVGSLVFSAALTAFLTGITEPLEFTFLFVAPLLYAFHAVYAGLSFMLMHIFQVAIGQTFSGGFIDFTLFGILQGNAKTNYLTVLLLALVYFPLYYFTFRILITTLDLPTPGREKGEEEVKLYTKADYNAKKDQKGSDTNELEWGKTIIEGLGGADNLVGVENCISRLRVSVKDGSKVNQGILKATGAKGVIILGQGVQVVYGSSVSQARSAVDLAWGNNG